MALTKSVLLLAVACCFFACSSVTENPTNCSDFKTGEFTFSENSDVRIIRTETYQKEYSTADGGFIDRYGIEWISSCEYKLWLESTTHPEDLDMEDGDTMYVQITAYSPKGYSFKAAFREKIFERDLYWVKK